MTLSSTTKAKIGAILGVIIPVLTTAASYLNAGTLPSLSTFGTIGGAITLAWGILHASNSAPATK